MKRCFLLVAFISATLFDAGAQNPEPKTVFNSSKVNQVGVFFQGYGEITPVLKQPVWFSGMAMGVTINRRFKLGLSTHFMVNNLRVDPQYHIAPFTRMRWRINYYGMLTEYTFFPDKVASLNLGAVTGFGTVGKHGMDAAVPDSDETVDDSRFFAFRPYAGVDVNFTRYLALGIQGGYRLGVGSDTQGINMRSLSGPFAQVMLRFTIGAKLE